jgi:hypothetical protein
MKTLEWEKGKCIMYRIACDCNDPEHDMTIDFEWDEGILELFFYKTIYWKHYYASYPWYDKLWKRISASFKLLLGGYIEMQGDFLIMKEEHIDSFIEALEEGKGKIKSWTEENQQGV